MTQVGPSLPAWLAGAPTPYSPPRDRDAYLRRNALRLLQLLRLFRGSPPVAHDPLGRQLARVPTALRIVGVLAAVLCVSIARNLAFVWAVLAVILVATAARPADRIASVLRPALAAAALAALVNLPAAALGQPAAPLRVATKAFVTVALVTGLATSVSPERLLGGLARLGLPAGATATIELTLRDLALIGSEAATLAEALELRSVGRNRRKAAGVTGVVGMVYLRAQRRAVAQAEAMALRGYDGTSHRPAATVGGASVAETGTPADYLALSSANARTCALRGTGTPGTGTTSDAPNEPDGRRKDEPVDDRARRTRRGRRLACTGYVALLAAMVALCAYLEAAL